MEPEAGMLKTPTLVLPLPAGVPEVLMEPEADMPDPVEPPPLELPDPGRLPLDASLTSEPFSSASFPEVADSFSESALESSSEPLSLVTVTVLMPEPLGGIIAALPLLARA
jgi:hypothetical protein